MNRRIALSPPARVLLVDDEPTNIQILAEALADTCELSFTLRGEEVQALAARLQPDLILLDLLMPGMHGLEVLAALREDPVCAAIPVIFVTALSELDDEAAGLEAGAVDYITKPISPAIVRARVQAHVELKRQRDQLAQLAEIDGLTGIANRRRFDRELATRWQSAQRHGDSLCLMLADVDHFKQYNDHFGHGPGDHCLRAVAGALADTLGRSDDLVARYGGEEFGIVVRSGDELPALLRSVLFAVDALRLPHPLSSAAPWVSLSIGALVVTPRREQPLELALAAADSLLYAAKRQGRRRALFRLFEDASTHSVLPGDSP
ncbi:MAG TPA: diguanylate cyclase [Arenimonas sp.]|nr:diguanylate cyclase [Arenimonas sp.]